MFNRSKEKEAVEAHPEGEVQIAANPLAETGTSVDTFAGKIHVKWAPNAAVSSLGLAPFFIEFLKTSGLFDKWVADCPLSYTSGNAPEKRDVLGTLLLSVLSGHWRYAHINAIRGDGINPGLLLAGVAGNDGGGMKAIGRGRSFEGQLRAAAGRAVRRTLITVTSWRISGWCWTWRCKRAIRRRRHLRNRNCGRFWTDSRSGAGPCFCAGTAIGELRKPWLEPRSANVKKLIGQIFRKEEWAEAGKQWQGREEVLRLSGWSKERRVVVLRRGLPSKPAEEATVDLGSTGTDLPGSAI